MCPMGPKAILDDSSDSFSYLGDVFRVICYAFHQESRNAYQSDMTMAKRLKLWKE